jgi:hypothetical protein
MAKKKYDKFDDSIKKRIKNQTLRNEVKKNLLGIKDPNRSKRINENKCVSCFYAPESKECFFLQINCQICRSMIISPDPGKRSVCASCSMKNDVCTICHGEIEK